MAEGLGTKLDALDHSEVGKKLGRQIVYRQAAAHGERHALDYLPGLGGHDLGP